MNVDRLKRNLMDKLVNARIDIAAYLQLRRAKGYMSVSENDHLRDNLFELCAELRGKSAAIAPSVTPQQREALHMAGEAMASAAVCLMTGHHDCPLYIAVNVETLERCLTTLDSSIQEMNALAPLARA